METPKFLRKSGELLIGKIVYLVNLFLSSIFFARGLGAVNYGLLTLSLSILGIVGRLFSFGFEASNQHFIAKYYKKNKRKATKVLRFFMKWRVPFSITAGIVLFLSSGLISTLYDYSNLAMILKILSVGFIFNLTQTVIFGAFAGIKKMKFVSYGRIFWAILKAIPIAFAVFGFGLMMVSWGYTFIFIVNFFLCLLLLAKELNLKEGKGDLDKGKVLKYGFFSYGTSLLGLGLLKATLVITGLFSVAHAGFLYIGTRIGQLSLFLIEPLTDVLSPTISDLWNRSRERAKVLFKRITRYRVFLTIPLLVLIILFGRLGIKKFYGKEFLSAYPVLVIISLTSLTQGLLASFDSLIMGTENVDIKLKSLGISVALNLSLAFLLIPKFGLKGAATGLTVGIISGVVWRSYKIKKKTKISYPKKAVVKSLISVALALIAAYPIYFYLHQKIWGILPMVMIFLPVYFGALLLLKGFRDFEVEFIKDFVKEKKYLDYLRLR